MRPPDSVIDPTIDWERANSQALDLLSRLVKIDTTNPPGRQHATAKVLEQFFEREGIEAELVRVAPGRSIVFAALEVESPARPPLLLSSHTDVFPTDPRSWPDGRPPFSDTPGEDQIWGRGVLDGKGLTVLHAMTLVLLDRYAIPRDRNILFASGTDGVHGGRAGAEALMAAHPEVGEASLALADGGLSVRDLLGDGRIIHAIASSDKGSAALKMTAVARQNGTEDWATKKLAHALSDLYGYHPRPRLTDPVIELLDQASEGTSFPKNLIYASPLFTQIFLLSDLANNQALRPLVTDTIEVARIANGRGPTRAHATLRCSLLPGTTPGEVRNRLRALIADPDVHVDIESSTPASSSAIDPVLFRLITEQMGRDLETPHAALPVMATLPTSGQYLRQLGVPVYGFVPFVVSASALRTIRGSGEHLPLRELERGLHRMVHIVHEITRAPDQASTR